MWSLIPDESMDEVLQDIAKGAAILGSGGGADPYTGALMARQALLERGPVTVLSPAEVEPDALVVPLVSYGAPTVVNERIHTGTEGAVLLETIAEVLGEAPTHVTALEVGGVNGLIPITMAARAGLPLVDGDLMGRAFPEIQMSLPTLAGLPATPVVLADGAGDVRVAETAEDNREAELWSRSQCVDMGGLAMMACFPLRGRDLSRGLLPGTLSQARDLGRAVRLARLGHSDPVEQARLLLRGSEVCVGTLRRVDRRVRGGFSVGSASIETEDSDSTVDLLFYNEILRAARDDDVLAQVPNLICVLESNSGEPLTIDQLRYGAVVTVLTAPCAPSFRTPEGLEVVGPEVFDLPLNPVPEPRSQPS